MKHQWNFRFRGSLFEAKIHWKSIQNQNASKRGPKDAQDVPRRSQDFPRRPQDGPKTPSRRPKTPPRLPRCLQEVTKTLPRRPQDRQLGAMSAPKRPLEAPKRPSRRPKRPLRRSQEALQEVLKIAKIRQEASGGSKRPPGSIFGGFLIHFWWILGGCWVDLSSFFDRLLKVWLYVSDSFCMQVMLCETKYLIMNVACAFCHGGFAMEVSVQWFK